MFEADKLFDLLKKENNIKKRIGLLFFISLSGTLFILYYAQKIFVLNTNIKILISLGFPLIICVVDFVNCIRIPRFSSSHGIILYFESDFSEESKVLIEKIKGRLIDALVQNQDFNYEIKFLNDFNISKHLVNSNKYKNYILAKSMAVLFFTCKVYEGKIQNEDKYSLSSSYAIRHKLLDNESRFYLSKDISSILIDNFEFSNGMGLIGIKEYSFYTSITISIALAIIDLIDEKFQISIDRLEYVKKLINNNKNAELFFKDNVDNLLIQLYTRKLLDIEGEITASIDNKKFDIKELNQYKSRIDKVLVKIENLGSYNDVAVYFKAASHFLLYRDSKAISKMLPLNKCYKDLSVIERIDKAFIYIYNGRIDSAFNLYKKIISTKSLKNVNISQILNYIEYIKIDEPDRIQMLIPIIMLNHYFADKKLAKYLFEELCISNEFNKLRDSDKVKNKLKFFLKQSIR